MWQAMLRHGPNCSPTSRTSVSLRSVPAVEERHRLAHPEVTSRPGVRPAERPGEEPICAPAAEAALRRDRLDHLLVRQLAEPLEVELAAREAVTYSALRAEKPTSRISRSAAAAALAGREHPRHLVRTPNRSISRERTANAEWSDTCWAVITSRASPRDRGRAAAGIRQEARAERPSVGSAASTPRSSRDRAGLRASSLRQARSRRRAARRRHHRAPREPDLAAGDDAVEPAVLPHVRPVGPVGAEALGGRGEVVRLWESEQGDAPIVRTPPFQPEMPRERRGGRQALVGDGLLVEEAREASRANTRAAASETHWSETPSPT